MKKLAAIIKKARPIGLAFALLMPLFACQNGNAPTETPEPTAIVTERPTIAPTEAPTAKPAPEAPTAKPTPDPEEQKRAEVEVLVRKYCELIQPWKDEMSLQLETAGITLETITEATDLVCEYTFSYIDSTCADGIFCLMDSIGEELKDFYNELETFAGDDSVRLIMRFKKSNGMRVINYVIDKDYEPPTEFFGIIFDTLQELAEDEYFISIFESYGMCNFTVNTEVVDATTLVVNYTPKSEMLETDPTQYKSEWEQLCDREGKGMTAMVLSYTWLFVPSVQTGDVNVVFRLYDQDGNRVSEYRAYDQPGAA